MKHTKILLGDVSKLHVDSVLDVLDWQGVGRGIEIIAQSTFAVCNSDERSGLKGHASVFLLFTTLCSIRETRFLLKIYFDQAAKSNFLVTAIPSLAMIQQLSLYVVSCQFPS